MSESSALSAPTVEQDPELDCTESSRPGFEFRNSVSELTGESEDPASNRPRGLETSGAGTNIPSSSADAGAAPSYPISAATWSVASAQASWEPHSLQQVWPAIRESLAFAAGQQYILHVSSRYSTWVGTVERAIAAHHGQDTSRVSRARGFDLRVVPAKQAAHVRLQPVSDSTAAWWSSLHTIVQKVLRHRTRQN